MIELNPFEAALYEGESIVLKKKDGSAYETINEDQWHLLKHLKATKDVLTILLPSNGVATKKNIEDALDLLRKLRNLNLIEFLNGSLEMESARTTEISITKEKIRLDSVESLGASIVGIFSKATSFFSAAQIFILVILLAGLGLVLFPFDSVVNAVRADTYSYLKLFSVIYLSFCLAFSVRTLFQAAYIRGTGRGSQKHGFSFYGPFLGLFADSREVYMRGRSARMQLALVGVFAPLTLILFVFGLQEINAITLTGAFLSTACFMAVSLLLLCPIMAWDGAEFFHCVLRPETVEQNTSGSFNRFLSGEGEFHQHHIVLAFLAAAWSFLWMDSVRSVADIFLGSYSSDLYFASDLLSRAKASIFFAFIYLAMAFPFLMVFYGLSNRVLKKQFSSAKSEISKKETLSFEEQMAVLEKIPLFAALSDQNRVALFNEMRSEFFEDGVALVKQGEPGDEFFVLTRGKAKALFTDSTEKVHHVGVLQEGDAFGEVALIDDVPRTASIVSQGGCHALILKKADFEKFLTSVSSPDSVKQMIRLTSFFRRHPLFSKLSAKDQAAMIDAIRFEFITLNETVGSEQAGNVYIVYSGKLKVDTGDDSTDLFLHAEDFFGYAGQAGALRVTALEGAGVLQLREEDFRRLIWEKLAERPGLFL